MSCEQVAELGAALALDALEGPERETLEAHVRGCADCAGELAELREVAAQLALAVPQREPPVALRQRIMDAARGDLSPAGEPRGLAAPLPRPSWLQRWAPGLALASLALALAALLWAVSLQTQLTQTQQRLAETSTQLDRVRSNYWAVASVLASPAVQVRDLQADQGVPAAAAKVWVDPATGQGMMMARELPSLPPDKVYQVWLTNPGGRVAGGQLRSNDQGVYYTVLQPPGRVTDYQRIGVTVEPAGTPGAGPTGPRVVFGEI